MNARWRWECTNSTKDGFVMNSMSCGWRRSRQQVQSVPCVSNQSILHQWAKQRWKAMQLVAITSNLSAKWKNQRNLASKLSAQLEDPYTTRRRCYPHSVRCALPPHLRALPHRPATLPACRHGESAPSAHCAHRYLRCHLCCVFLAACPSRDSNSLTKSDSTLAPDSALEAVVLPIKPRRQLHIRWLRTL